MRLFMTFGFAASAVAQGYLQVGFEKRTSASAAIKDEVTKRQSGNPVNIPIYQNTNKLEYIVNITVGTPGQTMGVTVDTGSSDLWIPSSQFCRRGSCDLGDFNAAQSSTYTDVEQGGFNITYAAPGDSDGGDWGMDSIQVGGSPTITGQLFGLASAGADSHGVMGLGFDNIESSNPSGTYPTILDNMVNQDIISRKAFSMYLDSLNQTTGNLVFGGVDNSKYTGPLIALPMQPSPGGRQVHEYYVTLTEISFNDAAGENTVLTPRGYAQSVLLDAGSSATMLGADIIGRIANGLGAVDVGGGSYDVPCSYANTNTTISYKFGGNNGPTVSVPVAGLLGGKDKNLCNLAIAGPIGGVCILGDSFLRSAYAVFDLDNKLAALAQAVDGEAKTSNIVAFSSGTMIPGASSTASASGTHLSSAAATSSALVPTASYTHRSASIIPGTPTFNLGSSYTQAAGSSTSNIAAVLTGKPQAALMGAGLIAGALVW